MTHTTTGGIPRSIKRILNTFSLLDYIALEKNESSENDPMISKQIKLRNLEARFIIVALHINYPEICKRLMEKPDFTSWNLDVLNTPWELEKEANEQQIKNLANTNLGVYFDESWEQVAYCLCSKDDWLKKNAINVSRLLNMLRDALQSQEGESEDGEQGLSDDAQQILGELLESIRVISIDNDTQTQGVGNQQAQERLLSQFAHEVWRKFMEAVPSIKANANFESLQACWDEEGCLDWEIKVDGEPGTFTIRYVPDDAWLGAWWTASRHRLNKAEAREIVGDLDGTGFWDDYAGKLSTAVFDIAYGVENFEMQTYRSVDFLEEFADKVVESYKLCKSLSKKMEKATR